MTDSLLLQSGDLVFVRGNDFISKEIEKISKSIYSHVAGSVDGTLLVEAQGFRKTGYQKLYAYTNRFDVYRCDEITNEQREQIVAYVKNEIGTRYNYFLIGWEFIRYLTHLMLPFPNESHEFICSTLWADAYLSAGIELCPWTRFPSPEDLVKSKRLKKVKV